MITPCTTAATITKSTWKHLTTAALTITFLVVATGCSSSKAKPTPENFTHALNSYFLDHKDCLLADTHFPYETTDKAKTKQMDSLAKALLLKKEEEMSIHASRYTVTDAGARFAPKFCYGHREVTSIDSFTPPAVANGFNQTAITYHYEMKEVPVWAKTPEVQAAFPEMAQATSGQSTGKATLGQTPAGWQVPE
jgi:hypothetical protein